MKSYLKDTLSILGVAALTMGAALAVFAPQTGIEAGDEETVKTVQTLKVKIKPVISQPTLEADHCTLKLKLDKKSYDADDTPTITVTVTNNSDKAVERSFEVSMKGRDLFSRSRMPAMAVVIWSKTTKVSLKAGESKTVTLEASKIPAAKAISFSMSIDEKKIETLVSAKKPVQRRAAKMK